MTIEEKIQLYKSLGKQIEELEEQKKLLAKEILQAIPQDTKMVRIADYNVRRISRLSIKISLENARLLDAVKMEEVIDKDRIKELYEKGHELPDVSEYSILNIAYRPTSNTESSQKT